MNYLVESGRFAEDVVPAPALHCWYLYHYFCSVENGGHAAFIGDGRIVSEFPGRTESGCRAALAAIGLKDLQVIF